MTFSRISNEHVKQGVVQVERERERGGGGGRRGGGGGKRSGQIFGESAREGEWDAMTCSK